MKSFSLNEHLANPSRKIVTRDGRAVKIHCTNFSGIFPIIAEIESMGKSFSYNEDGKISYVESSIYDLFFVPEIHEGWINVYSSSYFSTSARIFSSEGEAKEEGKKWKDYVTTVKIEWET